MFEIQLNFLYPYSERAGIKPEVGDAYRRDEFEVVHLSLKQILEVGVCIFYSKTISIARMRTDTFYSDDTCTCSKYLNCTRYSFQLLLHKCFKCFSCLWLSSIRISPPNMFLFYFFCFSNFTPCYFRILFLALDIGGSRALSRCKQGEAARAPLIMGCELAVKKNKQIRRKLTHAHMQTYTQRIKQKQLSCSALCLSAVEAARVVSKLIFNPKQHPPLSTCGWHVKEVGF